MEGDRILLKGMVFYGYHGDREEERKFGQRFIVDLEVYASLSEAGASDRLEDTVDYGEVYRRVKGVLDGPSKRLIEALAEEVARQLLEIPKVRGVKVVVKKPGVAIKDSVLEYAAVEVEREKTGG